MTTGSGHVAEASPAAVPPNSSAAGSAPPPPLPVVSPADAPEKRMSAFAPGDRFQAAYDDVGKVPSSDAASMVPSPPQAQQQPPPPSQPQSTPAETRTASKRQLGPVAAPKRDEELARLRRELAEARARAVLAEQGIMNDAPIRPLGGNTIPPLGEGWGLPPTTTAVTTGALWAWPHERERLREHEEQARRAWQLAARAPGAHHFGFDACVVGARGAGVTSLCAAMSGGSVPVGGGGVATVRYAAAAAPVPLHLRIGLVELRAGDADEWTACGCTAGVFVFHDQPSLTEALDAAERLATELPVRILAFNAPAGGGDDSEYDEDVESEREDGAAALRAAQGCGLSVVEVCALSCRGVGALLDSIADAAWHRLLAWPPESAMLADHVRIGPLCTEDPTINAEMAAVLWEGSAP